MALSGSHTGTKVSGYSLRIDWSATQNIASNTSTITANAYLVIDSGYSLDINPRTGVITIDGTNYNISYHLGKKSGGTYHLGTASKTITHNADGTRSFAISGSARIEASVLGYGWVGTVYKGSNTYTLNTIARESQPTLSASTRVLGSTMTIYTNRASSSFTHTISYKFGSQTGTIGTGVGSSVAWTLPAGLASAIPNATSGVGTITCTTYNGSTLIGSKTASFTATVPNNSTFRPTASISSVVEGGSVPSGITVFVQNQSRAKVTSTGTGKYNATIKTYSVTVGGIGTYSGSAITSGVLNNSGSVTITLRVTDSRGYSDTISRIINVQPYSWMVSQPTLNVSTRAMGSAITIYTNRASTSFTHTLTYAFGNQSGTIATGITTSRAWTLPASLANAIPNATSGAGTITCRTYNGSTLIGSKTVSFTATVPNNETFQPSASISNITEGGSGLSGFTVFVQHHSQLNIRSSGSGKYNATIKEYLVTYDYNNYYGSNITTNPVANSGTRTITVRITDSRGYSTTVTTTVSVVPYFAPKINSLSAERSPHDEGTDLSASINFEIAPVSNQNTKQYLLRYRETGGSWFTVMDSTNFYSRIYTHSLFDALNLDKSYEVELIVYDSFTSIRRTVQVGTGFTLLNFNTRGKGMAIGKVSESDSFEVGMPAEFTEGMKVSGPAEFTDRVTFGGDTSIGNAGSAGKAYSWGGFHSYSSNNVGIIRIYVGNSNVMFNARISLWSYNYLADITVGGYTYTATGDWYRAKAMGQVHAGFLNVRFSGSGTNRYIQIGDTNTDWGGYLHVTIDDVSVGYGGSFPSPFEVSLETSYIGTSSQGAVIGETGGVG